MATKQTVALVQRSELRKTKRGENFATLSLNLGAAANFTQVNGKIWQADRYLSAGRALPADNQIVKISYREEEYEGRAQWVLDDYHVLTGDELLRAQSGFVQPEKIDTKFYRDKLETLIDRTDVNRVPGMVLREVFDRAGFREAFHRAPAAKSRHQNYPGGLLEHTLNVTSLAVGLAETYSPPGGAGLSLNCDRVPVDIDLLIAAGLLHDIGKIDTYRFAPLSVTTDANNFEGHLVISYAIVRGITTPLLEAPPYPAARDEVDKLLNCILSHHGSLEFGSPVLPACVEAYFLCQADVTDARIAEIVTEGRQTIQRDPAARWIRTMDFPAMFVGDWPRASGEKK